MKFHCILNFIHVFNFFFFINISIFLYHMFCVNKFMLEINILVTLVIYISGYFGYNLLLKWTSLYLRIEVDFVQVKHPAYRIWAFIDIDVVRGAIISKNFTFFCSSGVWITLPSVFEVTNYHTLFSEMFAANYKLAYLKWPKL